MINKLSLFSPPTFFFEKYNFPSYVIVIQKKREKIERSSKI